MVNNFYEIDLTNVSKNIAGELTLHTTSESSFSLAKLWAVIYYTFRESLARKTFIAFFIISTIALLLFLLALNIDLIDGANSAVSVFGQQARGNGFNIPELIFGIEAGIAAALFTMGLFFSIFATSSLIPNMLEKGNIDWIVAKPISREMLLIGRYLGALGIVAFNVFYLIGGSFLILSIKSGVWNFSFLLTGVLITFVFAVLYAVMALLGVVFQNSAIAIIGAYLIIFLNPLLLDRDRIYALLSKKIYQILLDGFYYIIPKTVEIGNIVRKTVMNEPIHSWSPIFHSFIIGFVFLVLAVIVFKRKNF